MGSDVGGFSRGEVEGAVRGVLYCEQEEGGGRGEIDLGSEVCCEYWHMSLLMGAMAVCKGIAGG